MISAAVDDHGQSATVDSLAYAGGSGPTVGICNIHVARDEQLQGHSTWCFPFAVLELNEKKPMSFFLHPSE